MVYLFVAYTIIFLAIAWYIFNIGQQHKKLSTQIEALEQMMGAGGVGADSKGSARRA